MGRNKAAVLAAMLDLSPTTERVTEPGLSPTDVGVINLQDLGGWASQGFWQLFLISALGPSQTIVGVTDPHN